MQFHFGIKNDFRTPLLFRFPTHFACMLRHGRRLPQHMVPVVAMVTVLTMLPSLSE